MMEPGRVIDRYVVEGEIGSGGMATVYKVRHATLGSWHALKVLKLHGATVRERLVQEGKVQATLRHPNIVAVTDVVDVDGAPGLVMEYVEGPTLDAWLRSRAPDLATVEHIFRGVLSGVARAHRAGLVHRDLKPGNILLAESDDGVEPKVTDFGLAKLLVEEEGVATRRTRSGVAMGTPAYMAPEQVRDTRSVDQRADIFALGCILYEMLVGRAPFEQADVLSTFQALASGSYEPPERYVSGLPPRFSRTIAACLQPDRERRAPDCAAVRQTFDGEGDGTPAVSLPRALRRESQPSTPVTATPAAGATMLPPSTELPSPGPRHASGPTYVGFDEPPSAGGGGRPASVYQTSESPPPRSRRWWLAALVGGAAVALLAVGAGGTGWWLSSGGRLASAPPVEVAAAPAAGGAVGAGVEAPPPPVEPEAAPALAPGPVEPPAAEPEAPVRVSPAEKEGIARTEKVEVPAEPAPLARPPEPVAAPAPTTATIRLGGDASSVRLQGEAGSFGPGEVPAGSYKVRAVFPGLGEVAAGSVTVAAGQVLTLECRSDFQLCKAR